MNAQKGFSLAETVTVAVLVAVLAGGLLGFYRFNAAQLRQGTSVSLLQQYYDAALDQMGRNARAASAVLGAGETFANRGSYAAGNAVSVKMYDDTGTVFVGYRIQNGLLQEFDPSANSWADFSVGPEKLRIVAGQTFGLPAGRTGLTIALDVLRTSAGANDTLDGRGGEFACRN